MAKKEKGFVSGHDEMIGRGSFANMPSETVMKEFPKAMSGLAGMLDDSITGVDSSMREGEGKARKYVSNQKQSYGNAQTAWKG